MDTMTMSLKFSPQNLPFNTTLARQIARQHLTHFNNVLWVGEHSYQVVRKSYSQLKMPSPGPGVHGHFKDDAAWRKGSDEFRSWTRQHILISAASLLEVYVQSAATAALSAKPELVDRSLENVAGITFIKHPNRLPRHFADLVATRVDGLTKGLWADRFRRMAQIFGVIPPALSDLSKDLQSIQDQRNRIAHSYGVSGELRRTPWQPLEAIVISPSRLVAAIKSVSAAIRLIDDNVLANHIGAYEILHEFDVWSKKEKNFSQMRVAGTLPGAFRDHIGRAFGQSHGSAYIKQMIAYYVQIA